MLIWALFGVEGAVHLYRIYSGNVSQCNKVASVNQKKQIFKNDNLQIE